MKGRAVRQFDGKDVQTLSLAYQDGLGLTVITDVDGNQATMAFTGRNTIDSIVDAGGGTTQKAFDANFNLSQITDAAGATTEMTWSEDGTDLEQVRDAAENVTDFEYENHNLTKITDALGRETNMVYEGKLLVSSTDDDGNTTTYTYTTATDAPQPIGLLKMVTDARDHTTTYIIRCAWATHHRYGRVEQHHILCVR